MQKTNLNNFTMASGRPLPVILLADISGSMAENGKISILNRSIRDMGKSLAEASNASVELQIAVITFGGTSATLQQDLVPATQFIWTDASAKGRTPLGQAFKMAKILLEDKQKISGRSYTPAIILVSDARPTDTDQSTDEIKWTSALSDLLSSERASKAERYALAIGEDANMEVMKKFIVNPDVKIWQADEASDINRFFQYVTLSISARSRSANPNLPRLTEADDWDDLVY